MLLHRQVQDGILDRTAHAKAEDEKGGKEVVESEAAKAGSTLISESFLFVSKSFKILSLGND